MKDINVNVVVEISIDMCLNKVEATELLHFLKTAVPAPRPLMSPHTGIVTRLVNAIEKGVDQS